jgi:hypothetical protein
MRGPPRGMPGGPLMHRDDTPTLTKPIAESEEVNRLFQQFLLRLRNRPSRRITVDGRCVPQAEYFT